MYYGNSRSMESTTFGNLLRNLLTKSPFDNFDTFQHREELETLSEILNELNVGQTLPERELSYEQVSSINSSLLMGQPRQFSFYFMFHFKIQMTISTDEYVTVIIKQINYIDYIMKKSNYSGEVVVAAGGHFFVTEGAIIS